MTAYRMKSVGGLPPASFLRSLLLPLLFLLAQHGALLHELGHEFGPVAQEQGEKKNSAGHPCEICLAFAQVQSAATADYTVPPLLAGLSFAPSATRTPTALAARTPARRNRGPPARA